MKTWPLLREMMLKELRTTLRERHQLLGLVLAVLALAVVLGSFGMQLDRKMRRSANRLPTTAPTAVTQPSTRGSPVTEPAAVPWPRRDVNIARWAAIAAGASVGLFFSIGYVMAATLASFAGEKENRTLEILLASPIPDSRLFFTKCLAVLLPMAALGYIFLVVIGVIVAVFGRNILTAPLNVPLHMLIYSIPFMLIPQFVLVGIGAAVSARADTVKGAGQVLGAIFFVIFFGGGYGLPLLIRLTPLRRPITHFARDWFDLPFALQYVTAFALLLIPAALAMAAGRAMFRRNRLLA